MCQRVESHSPILVKDFSMICAKCDHPTTLHKYQQGRIICCVAVLGKGDCGCTVDFEAMAEDIVREALNVSNGSRITELWATVTRYKNAIKNG